MSEFAIPDDVVAGLDNALQADGGNFGGNDDPELSEVFTDRDAPAQGITQQGDQNPSVATTPEAQTPPVAPAAGEGDPQPVAPADGTPEEDSFTDRFDPNSLPPELQPAYKLLQADYTRKRQADAEAIRRMSQYEGVDLDTAVALLTRVGDPQGLSQFIQEASDYLVSEGFAEFDDGIAQAQQQGVNPAVQPGTQDNLQQALAAAQQDPDMAPIVQQIQAMQQQLDGFRSESEQRLAAEREETQWLQVLGELQRQENVIVTDNPHYKPEDIESIYRIASYFDGDLFKAQEAYEADFARRLGMYMHAKDSAPTPTVPTGLPTPQTAEAVGFDPTDMKQAHAAALDLLKIIESQPE